MKTVIIILVIAIVIETLVISAFISTVNTRINKLENYLDEDSIKIKNLLEHAEVTNKSLQKMIEVQDHILKFIKDNNETMANLIQDFVNEIKSLKSKKTTKKVTDKQ